MKKFLSILLAFLVALSFAACAKKEAATENNDAKPIEEKKEELFCTQLTINGTESNTVSYKIGDYDYYSIFDVALLLKDTDAAFDVTYKEVEDTYYITPGIPYSQSDSHTGDVIKNPTATTASASVYCDGKRMLLDVYEIDGEYYFCIDDIAQIINFSISYSADGKSLNLDTAKAYESSEGEAISLNEFYLSLMGRTKAEIDTLLGEPTGYYSDFGVVIYGDNQQMFGFNTLGQCTQASEVPSSNRANVAYIPIKDIFNNCPDTLTVNQIKSIFPDAQEGYNEMDGFYVVSVSYNGFNISFEYPDSLKSSYKAFLKAPEGYTYSPVQETVEIKNNL